MDKTAEKILSDLEKVDPAIARLPLRSKELIGFAFVHAYTLGIQGVAETFGASPTPVPPGLIMRYYKGAIDTFRNACPPSFRGLFP